MPKCECLKNICKCRQSAAKPRIEEGSTTRVYARRATSDWWLEAVDSQF